MQRIVLIFIALLLVISSAAGIISEISKVYLQGKPLVIGNDTAVIGGKIQTGVSVVVPPGYAAEGVIDNAVMATVRITAINEAGVPNSAGSGVSINPEGLIVTSAHVVDKAVSVNVTFFNGLSFPAGISEIDSDRDIAVLSLGVQRDNLPAISLGDSQNVSPEDKITILGYPLGDFSVTPGIISRTHVPSGKYGGSTIQLDAIVLKGNSGGPVIDYNGNVIGIIVGSYYTEDPENRVQSGVAIPVDEAKLLLENMN